MNELPRIFDEPGPHPVSLDSGPPASPRATRQVDLLRTLREAATERARWIAQIDASRQTRITQAESDAAQSREQFEREGNAAIARAKAEFREKLAAARAALEQGRESAEKSRSALEARTAKEHAETLAARTRDRDQAVRKAAESFESRSHQLATDRLIVQQRLDAQRGRFESFGEEARRLLARRGSSPDLADASRTITGETDESDDGRSAGRRGSPGAEPASDDLTAARLRLDVMTRAMSARFLDEGWPVLCAIAGAIAAIYPVGAATAWNAGITAGSVLASGAAFGIASRFVGRWFARRATERAMPGLRADFARIARGLRESAERADRDLQSKRGQLTAWRRDEEGRAAESFETAMAEAARRRDAAISEARTARARTIETLEREWDRRASDANTHDPPRIARLERELADRLAAVAAEREQRLEESAIRRDRDLARSETAWRTVLDAFEAEAAAMRAYRRTHFPDWNEFAPESWNPPTEPLDAIPFGDYRVRLADLVPIGLRGSVASDREYELPAVLSAPDCPSLLLEVADQGRDAAARVMRNVMLRRLTAVPPGKIRFTLIDPVGLGQEFSAFMHLADYDERLVHNRIWTEPDQIRQRLADLSEHMENVIQKYLRNEYASIQEYNREAGEVAEPIHVLVVSHFPEGFGEESSRRLASIAATGPRCGVYLLASIDMRLRLPHDFHLREIEERAATLVWSGAGFTWKHSELARWPLRVSEDPRSDQSIAILRKAGEKALGANRVEVPFRTVAPEPDAWWSMDGRRELVVPLGRSGATKLQSLRLGRGTSQHVLVAGKTGSGKSTLFHALITNLALRYGPTEVELYLIDFKKGVEFKAYARHRLPHARVVAIESEREFGLSTLERLDEELKARGERFRKCGAQDIAGFRDANPDVALPRIVLVIDEFQEFFVKEDRIARDAALLLDRLVRQGRAFGVHVILGSQTLAGAYSLARSTLGQMAVRIALQCGETDAHLILSEDNTAARLLSRPGEAIHNDANGMIEGNHLFQVVWLPDGERIEYLRKLDERARRVGLAIPQPVVFEGDEPAELASNGPLIEAKRSAVPMRPFGAWLGAAVAIKEPAFAEFARQAGANLLIVGQDRERIGGLLTAAAVGLWVTAGGESRAAHFIALVSGGSDAPDRDWWSSLSVGDGTNVLVRSPDKAREGLAHVARELERRLDSSADSETPWILVVDDLARFRDLRRDGTDYGFGGLGPFSDDSEKDEPASQRFLRIVREGPGVGIHTVLACDGYGTLSRWFDRQTLRDFALRVLLRMGPTDSSHLIDSPAASELGACRALFHREDRGESEKFRPYRAAPPDWRSTL